MRHSVFHTSTGSGQQAQATRLVHDLVQIASAELAAIGEEEATAGQVMPIPPTIQLQLNTPAQWRHRESTGLNLLDFGISKLIDPAATRTQTGFAAMTSDYASPEQVRGMPVMAVGSDMLRFEEQVGTSRPLPRPDSPPPQSSGPSPAGGIGTTSGCNRRGRSGFLRRILPAEARSRFEPMTRFSQPRFL